MSTLERMPLELAIPIIEKLYPSIVVKTLLLKYNEEWLNLFTMIFPTRKTVLDLEKEYNNLENKIGKIDFKNIKVIFQARNVEDLSKIINEIEKGYLKVGALNTKYIENTSKIKQQQFRHSSFNKFGELAEYESFSLICEVQKNVINTLNEYGISPNLFGLDSFDDIARSWFNVEIFGYSINVLIMIPVYAKIVSLLYEGGKSIKIDLKIDESIIKNTQLCLIRRGDQDRSPIIERKFYDVFSYQNTEDENFLFVQIKNEFQGINSNDVIEASIQHEVLGFLTKNILRMQYDLSPSEYPLLEAYKLFEANEMLDKNFENPNNDKDFEIAVYWYLELIGFHTIKLGKGEIIRENKVEKGSSDILFYDNESKTLFAVDCTIGVPPAEKIDKIRNTSNYISEYNKIPVKPIIFTPKICTTVKSNAKENEVKIIDKEDIIKLKEYFKNGYSYLPKARRFITEK